MTGPGIGADASRSGKAPPMFHRVMPARLDTVRQTLLDMRARFTGRVAEDALARLELVLAEVLNNIALHGTHGEGGERPGIRPVAIHLTVTRHGGGLACAVVDDGAALPAACLAPGDAPPPEIAALHAGGFGWLIIRDLTRSLFYFREGGMNVLCFNVPRLAGRQARVTGAA